MKRIAVIGSRTGFTYDDIIPELKNIDNEFCFQGLTDWNDYSLISGGAPGIDTYVHNWNSSLPYPKAFEIIRPINTKNKINYLFRNCEIIAKADAVLVFWDGKSKGTKFVIDYAKARNKDVRVFMDG